MPIRNRPSTSLLEWPGIAVDRYTTLTRGAGSTAKNGE